MKYKEKGFTLIELLAVIIILAIIALIVTPVVLKVIDNAKESARKSSVAGYADAVKLAINEKTFENKGFSPVIDQTFLNGITYQGSITICNEVKNSNNFGVILKECTVGSNTNLYCFAKGKVYNCEDEEFTNIYNNINGNNNEKIIYKDNSGANSPVLYNNMIPVKYDEGNWVYADIYNEWYNYDNKNWANAVVLINSPSKTYSVGDSILMDDISQMYVWIPRYKYIIFNGNNGSVAAQEINIIFESDTSSTGTVSCTDTIAGSGSSSEICTDETNDGVINGTSTYTHPAFTFGTTSLTGFWAGKFEVSGTTSEITIKPNLVSLRSQNISKFFTSIKSIENQYSIDADSHMMKNMEWGAVAYFEASKYGLGTTDIGINNNSNYTTGCGAVSGSSSSTECNTYDTDNGKLASTTGNIYGIYDMSGGAWEYVMGDMVTSNNVPMVGYKASLYNSGFTGMLYDGTNYSGVDLPESKYYDLYTYDGLSSTTHSRGKLGDAIKETLVTYGSSHGGWYSDDACFPYLDYSWLIRGGLYDYNSRTGVFAFFYTYGYVFNRNSARAVITASN